MIILEGKFISGEVRYNLISLVRDGVEAYTDALQDPNSGFMANKESHLKSLDGLINLLSYLESD